MASVFALAVGAQAVTIGISSHGTAVFFGTSEVANETVDYMYGGMGAFTALLKTLDNPSKTGTAVYTGAMGSLTLKLSTESSGMTGNSATARGSWTVISGTGNYANLTGTGTWAENVHTPFDNAPSLTTMSGDLQAVPEPASMAALGIGVVAMLKRPKKA